MAEIAIVAGSAHPARCRSCGAPIVWVETARGKQMPVDPPLEILRSEAPLLGSGPTLEYFDTRHTPSHFQTCPQASAWRKAGSPR